MSSCTLRLSDKQMQSNFIDYLRDETKKKSLVVLIFFVLVTLLLCGGYIQTSDSEESSKNISKLLILHSGVITLTMGITVILSYKFPIFVEFISLSVLVPSMIIIYVSYSNDQIFDMDATSRNVQLQTFFLIIFMVTNFMSVDYLCHLIIRQCFTWACMSMIIIGRSQYDGENNVYTGFGLTLIFSLMFESVLYSNHRSKAGLFMRIKLTALQEDQLRNLLDTVPDKVLITSQPSENSAPKSFYSNRQMNEFFGCDFISMDRQSRK